MRYYLTVQEFQGSQQKNYMPTSRKNGRTAMTISLHKIGHSSIAQSSTDYKSTKLLGWHKSDLLGWPMQQYTETNTEDVMNNTARDTGQLQ
jgi:hypothetical protein